MAELEFEDLFRKLQIQLAEERSKETEVQNDSVDVRSIWGNAGSNHRDSGNSSVRASFTIDGKNWYTDNDGVTQFEGPGEDLSFRVQLIGFCEEFYHENFRMPTPKELQMRFRGEGDCPKYLHEWPEKVEEIREALEGRGIDLRDSPVGNLDPRFVSAVHLVLNYQDKRTVQAKLKHLELRTAQWHSWLKKPAYLEYYRKQLENVFTQETQLESKRILTEAVSAGDLQAVKYFNELTGAYRPQESATQAVIGTLLSGLFEILARHLPQDMIAQIGAEIREAAPIQRVMGAIEAESREAN